MFKKTKEKTNQSPHAPAVTAERENPAAKKSVQEKSLVYRLAYQLGMRQTKQLSRTAFFKRTAVTALILLALGTVLFVWLPRAAYVGTAELAVIIVVALIVFGRVILSLILGLLGFEKAKEHLSKKSS